MSNRPGRPKGAGRPTAVERASGFGKVGFCKICAHPGAQFINAAIVRAANTKPMNAAEMLDYMKMLDPEFKADRHTFYKHQKEHLTSPLVTAVQKTKDSGERILPKSNAEALEMVRDLGMKTAIENPETIGVDHALRAISEMEKKKGGVENLWVMLSRVQSGENPQLVIQGEYKEIETKQEVEIS